MYRMRQGFVFAVLFFLSSSVSAAGSDSLLAAQKQALLVKPFDTTALQAITDFYFSEKKYDSALVYLQAYRPEDSGKAALIYRKAFALYKLRRYEAATALLQPQVDTAAAGNAGSLLLAVLYQQHQYTACEALAQRLLAQHPDHISALLYQGILMRNKKNYAGALEQLEKCLQLSPGYLPALELHAEVLLHFGKYREALQDYEAVGMENIRSSASFNNIGICYYELQDFKSAIRYFELAMDSNWQLSEGYFNRGMAYYKSNSFDSASANWLAASALWDSCTSDTCRYFYKDALYCLGHCYKKLGSPERALGYFEWLQRHHYEKDLSGEIRKLRWSNFIATRWYFMVLGLVLVLALPFVFWGLRRRRQ